MRIFGDVLDGVYYKERKGVYGIAINELNQVAVIQMPHGDFLPGGGIDLNETEDECLRRELIEETGYSININSFICNGIQYGYGPKSGKYLKLVGSFYTIQLGHDTGLKSEIDHKLVWKDREELKKSIRIEYQYWAIEEAFRLKESKPLNKSKTYVGISSVDITPNVGVELDGYHRDSPSIGIKDRLVASIMIIKDTKEKFVLISADSIGVTVPLTDKIRDRVAEYLIINRQNIMLCYTHTHSSPKNLNEDLEPNDYSKFLEDRIVEGVVAADKTYYPCKIGWGCTSGDIAVNRREKTESGTAIMGENPFGVIDKRIGIMKVVNEQNDEIVAVLLRVSAHGNVLKGDNLYISADYFSKTRSKIEEKYNCKVMIINGAAGNLNAKFRGADEDLEKMACKIFGSVDDLIENIKVREINKISMKSKMISATTVNLPSLSNAEELSVKVSKYWEVDTSRWLGYVRDLIHSGKRNINVKYELQMYQINDGIICGCPMEVFSETSLEVSEKINNNMVFLNGYTNGYLMYLPSKDEFTYGGYEVEWCPVVYGPMFGILMPFNKDTEPNLVEETIKLITVEDEEIYIYSDF
jgi:8-oxo-dGTP pyrophosphatase MutT (NUDIX family)